MNTKRDKAIVEYFGEHWHELEIGWIPDYGTHCKCSCGFTANDINSMGNLNLSTPAGQLWLLKKVLEKEPDFLADAVYELIKKERKA